MQRKQRKHRTFLTLFLYTISKYLFIKILCFRCSWPINGVIKPFVAAQKLHKTAQNCTELHRTSAALYLSLHLYPHLAPKLHANVQLRHSRAAPVPRIESRIFLLVKPKGNNKTGLPTNSKWQIGLFLCLKPPLGGAACRRGDNVPPWGSRGAPWRIFGDFLFARKSPGCRAERLHQGTQGLCPCRIP